MTSKIVFRGVVCRKNILGWSTHCFTADFSNETTGPANLYGFLLKMTNIGIQILK